MRIYTVADIHGKQENIEIISFVLKKFKPDLIVIAGDITSYFRWRSALIQLDLLGQPAQYGIVDPISRGAESILPILCIRGNSDLKKTESKISKTRNLTLLNTSPNYIKGIPFIGTNGTIPLPFASRICPGENQLFKTLLPHMDKNTILVTHPPPRGICDKVGGRFSAGSRNLRDFIKITQPQMVLCGHIHEQAGTGFIKNTLVVNCAINKNHHGAVIDLEKDEKPRVNFLQP